MQACDPTLPYLANMLASLTALCQLCLRQASSSVPLPTAALLHTDQRCAHTHCAYCCSTQQQRQVHLQQMRPGKADMPACVCAAAFCLLCAWCPVSAHPRPSLHATAALAGSVLGTAASHPPCCWPAPPPAVVGTGHDKWLPESHRLHVRGRPLLRWHLHVLLQPGGAAGGAMRQRRGGSHGQTESLPCTINSTINGFMQRQHQPQHASQHPGSPLRCVAKALIPGGTLLAPQDNTSPCLNCTGYGGCGACQRTTFATPDSYMQFKYGTAAIPTACSTCGYCQVSQCRWARGGAAGRAVW